MRNLVLACLLSLLSVPALAACKGDLSGTWSVVTKPAGGVRAWRDNGGAAHDLSTGDTPNHSGNQTILSLDGTAGCTGASGEISFSDVPSTTTWLNVRLDRAGICAENFTAYPDTLSAGACLGLNKGNGACVLVGSEVPFGELPSQQPGGLYSVLYVVQSTNGTWSVVGTPTVFLNGPLLMDDTGQFSISYSDGIIDGSYITQGTTTTVSQNVQALDPEGTAGFQVAHNPNLMCSPKRGVQEVNVLEFLAN